MKVGFIGGGSWGATLANLLTDNSHEVLVYDINVETVNLINQTHHHPFFESIISEKVVATNKLEEVVSFSDILVLSVPTKVIRDVMTEIKDLINSPKLFINVSKGIEPETSLTVSQIADEIFDDSQMKGFVTLSGPSHAEEVIERKLTVLVSASKDEADAVYVQNLFANHKYIRVYSSTDILGVEVAGSVKNAIALISGICTGYGLGENARAALISRGILEIIRITEVLGGKKETAYGLAGIGDLIVTASSMNSRNFQAGLKIGQGQNVYDVVRDSKMVVEGARVLESAHHIAKKHNLYLPIIDTAYKVIFEDLNLNLAVEIILSAKLKSE
jgi:glycerol-3-phosphate dehydrogenase (NAD(P)+)